MNAIIQGQLDRIEAALNTLVSSIESYNPSVPAAIDLLAADTELQEGVRQHILFLTPLSVALHQAHHARILSLRSAIQEQEQQRKSTLTLLAGTRKDLLSTPATTFPEASRSVPYTELLDYASRISRYTVPPTFREPPPPPQQPASNAAPAANGISEAVTEAREANAVANGEGAAQGEEGKGVGEKSLEPNEMQWLNPQAQIPFTPWPTEDVIKRGALGQIQVMLEQGVDPGAGDAPEKGAEGGVEHAGEEHTQVAGRGGEAPREAGEGRPERGERRPEGQRREEKPKVFKGLDLDEDSDDD
ncbi:MAG: hypothetical protein LQ348_002262 [Seirophora lacunosa]|nr:MAG: hypothetical protein LQ348_002262 [Seirophora lacunosa]